MINTERSDDGIVGSAAARALALVTVMIGTLGASGCKSSTPPTVEAAHAELTAAASKGDAVEVYRLIDRKTQWSIISAFEAKREIRQLVRVHYPAARRARELRRTQVVAQAGNASAFFVAFAKEEGLLASLAKTGAGERDKFCREDKGWKYCGLRGYFDQLKVRAARDLALVKENAETFKKGR